MASQIPQTPRPPHGRERRRVFWHGVLAAVGVIGGLYFALTVYMSATFDGGGGGSYVSYSKGRMTNGSFINCAPGGRVSVVVDGRTETVPPEESRVWKFTDRNIAWGCGSIGRKLVCSDDAEYLLVVRYPDSDVLALRCEMLSIPRLRDAPT